MVQKVSPQFSGSSSK